MYGINIEAVDPTGHKATQAYSISVTDNNQPPAITNAMPARIPALTAFSHQIQATDPEGQTLIYSMQSQAQNMGISAGGLISWNTPQPGRYPITLVVADPQGATARQSLVLVVMSQPAFTSSPIVSATATQAYAYTAQAQDIDGDTLTYSLGQAPAGMQIDTATGAITWTPVVAGVHTITLKATDPDNNTATQTYTLTVRTDTNRAPVITSTATTIAVPNTNYSYQARHRRRHPHLQPRASPRRHGD